MKHLFIIAAVIALAGCGTVRKVETGSNTVGERFTMHLEGPWNHVDFPGIKPGQVWTMEGVTVDELVIYSGIKDGQVMHPENSAQSKKQNVVFRSNMPTEQIVSMFEGVFTRDDSIFKLMRVEPSTFGGKKGFLFEFERIRKTDNLRQLGFGYGAVDNGELFSLVYIAPALTFFPRHQARVEAIAHSAFIKPVAGSSSAASSLPPPTKVALRSQSREPSSLVTPTTQTLPSASAAPAITAQSSPTTLPSSPPVTSGKQSPVSASKEDRLKELKQLFEKGLVTKENYLDQQRRILDAP